MPLIRPEDKQRDETFDDWRKRTAGWRAVNKAAAQIEEIRRQLRATNSTITGLVDSGEIPESMREHVESWHNAARDTYSLMRELDITTWREQLRAELAEQLDA